MNITTTQKSNDKGTTKITAKGMGRQKTVTYDHAYSNDANHGRAAAALIQYVHSTMHPLTQQNGDDIRQAAVRSIDAGASTHTRHSATVHRFEV